ncbi:neuroglian isoform X1 [Patella vulgata]|uniref:neuroglian isoform X1 n=1 Tax=Patella vulgata TaxID=6465 RepID=UPI0024A8B020|nr:neuroglian isoform X1 [Patella vulgata]
MAFRTIWAFLWAICINEIAAITRPPGMFIQPSYDVYYKAGETVQMPCVADGEPQPKYTWTRNEIDFNPSGNDDRMVQLPNVGTIVINRPEDKDEALYQCFADNGYGISATININLRIAKLDDFATDDPIIHSPNLGDPLTLDCVLPDSVPSPQFYWAINIKGNNLAINYDARITLDHEARLRITNVKAEDRQEGRAYACIALNQDVRKVVSGVPNFIQPRGTVETLHTVTYMWASPSDHYGLRGDEFKLKCIFSGNPTPDVHWTRTKGGAMPEGIKITSFGQELVFPRLADSDAGEYECWALNTQSAQRAQSSFSIRVESRPYWTDNGPDDVEVGIGGSATFVCKAQSNPDSKTKWFVNGVPFAKATDPRITNGRFKVLATDTVQMVNVTRDDAMVIQCNVSNKHGYIWGDSYLNVLSESPTIIRPPEANQVTAEGLSVNISCLTTGKPDPQITWFIEGQQITGGRYITQLNGDLLIQNVVLSDAGNYLCLAENRYGKNNATGRLTVRRKTLIEQEPLDLEVIAGNDAKFTCSGTTDPEEVHNLEILWEKDNKPITPNDQRMTTNNQDNSLTISGTITRDSGTYTCIATNGLDNARKAAMLTVKDRPDAPTNVRVERCDSNATIRFTPGSYNNAPIQYFVIQYNTSFNQDQWNFGVKSDSTQTQVTLPLSPYANFTYRVIAYNKIGESDPSFPSESGCRTNPALPSKNPENLRTIGYKRNYLYMEWTPMPRIQQNGPGFQYVLQIKKRGDPDQNTNSITIDDWRMDRYEMSTGDIYQPYEITLKARNGQGEAGGAKTIIGFSGEDYPTVIPTNLATEMINITSATLSWNFDMNTVDQIDTPLRGEFKGFKIQYWEQQNKAYTVREYDISAAEAKKYAQGNKVIAVIKNLLPYIYIEARVSVMNNFFVSRPTDVIRFQTLPGVPGPVERFLARSIGNNHFNLEWLEPLDKNGQIIGYDIGYQTVNGLDLGKMQDREPQIRDSYQTSAMLSGLLSETKYRVYIWARTAQGRGDSYFIELVTTEPGSPQAPRYTIASVGEHHINITWWLNPYVKSGTVIFVEYRKLDAPEWLKSTDEVINRWKNITNLEAGTTYEVRVVATNGAQRSESSTEEVTTVGVAAATALIANIGWFIGMLLAVIIVIAIAVAVYCSVKAGLGFKRVETEDNHHPSSYSGNTSRLPGKIPEPKGYQNDYYNDKDSYHDRDHDSINKDDPPPSYRDYDRRDSYDDRRDSYGDRPVSYSKRDSYDERRDSYGDRDHHYEEYDRERDGYRDDPYDYQRQNSGAYDPDFDTREPSKFDNYGAPRNNYDDQVAYSDRSSRYSDRYDDVPPPRPASGGAGGASSSFV